MTVGLKNIAVLGLGNLGAQIAAMSAAGGYTVRAFDPDPGVFDRSLAACLAVDQSRQRTTPVKVADWPRAAERVIRCGSAVEALAGAELVVEAVPEKLEIKLEVWREMDRLAPAKAVLATNSSSLPVSLLAEVVSRPERCLNIHLYRPELGMNMADVMGCPATAEDVLETGRDFVRSIGLVPLTVKRELMGFCFNRIWRAVKREALHMWAGGFVDFRDIDRGYMIFNNTPWGPFALMDAVGLDVVRDVELSYFHDSGDEKDRPPKALLDKIEAGELGVKTGRGFYTYPDPEYGRNDFLDP